MRVIKMSPITYPTTFLTTLPTTYPTTYPTQLKKVKKLKKYITLLPRTRVRRNSFGDTWRKVTAACGQIQLQYCIRIYLHARNSLKDG